MVATARKVSYRVARQSVTGNLVTLAPQGRIARYEGEPLIAEVYLGCPEPSLFGGGQAYAHPEIRLRTVNPATGEERSGCLGTYTLQRSAAGVQEWSHDPQPGGCFATWIPNDQRKMTIAYGGKLECDLQYEFHAKRITRVMDLLIRARSYDVVPSGHPVRKLGCDLALLCVGLRRIGVEVRIRSALVERKRSQRSR